MRNIARLSALVALVVVVVALVSLGMAERAYATEPPVHCSNGVQDTDETGVDCGGAECAVCDIDQNTEDFETGGFTRWPWSAYGGGAWSVTAANPDSVLILVEN